MISLLLKVYVEGKKNRKIIIQGVRKRVMPVTVSSLMMTICCLWPFVSMMDLAGPDFRSQATLKTWWR